MKFYLLNGSPRNNWNTAKLLESCKEGITDTFKDSEQEADVEIVNLFTLNFKGCLSCFNCKLIDGPFYGTCPINDDLKDLIPKLWNCDGIVIGSPIYFSDVTGQTRNLIERLIFPKLVYGGEPLLKTGKASGLIFTMNAPKEYSEKMYNTIFENTALPLTLCYNQPRIIVANNTVQFDDYSKYENYAFNEEEKLEYEKENFPQVLKEAYDMGVEIAKVALDD